MVLGIKFWVGASHNNIKISDTKRFNDNDDYWYLDEDIFKKSKKGQYLYEHRLFRVSIRKISRTITANTMMTKYTHIFSNRKIYIARLKRFSRMYDCDSISYHAYNIYYN